MLLYLMLKANSKRNIFFVICNIDYAAPAQILYSRHVNIVCASCTFLKIMLRFCVKCVPSL